MHYPMHQYMPTGEAGQWMSRLGKAVPGYYQPIKVILPTEGDVTFCSGPVTEPVTTASPSQIGLAIGFTYRLQIRNLPEFPGVELYPTVELLDRLHPPAGHEHEFPIPIQLTASDLEHVLSGRLVTKVVYLEQPQVAVPTEVEGASLQFDLPPQTNLLAESDRLGRPLAIVRIGGRLPGPSQDLASYLWTPAPLAWEPTVDVQEVRHTDRSSLSRETSESSSSGSPRRLLPAGSRLYFTATQPLN
ncbi:MAG: hypothetical protein O2955_05250 [Planctomycetota bacterium]|nr:hypothetical protein [Planctomycetota bacterium]MDA1211900.1 hypothetical protein [Planctomycetota bacterium]